MSLKIAIFASGSGSNAENIINFFTHDADFEFPLIISNKKDAFIHERAKKLLIPTFTFSRQDFSTGESIFALLQRFEIDYIILAGFLLKVPQILVDKFPNKIVNIHPALLPKFGGKGMYGQYVHQAVVDAGDNESGITIHYVNSNYDEGSIIFQARCAVLPTDTADVVAEKVHALEYEHFPQIIKQLWSR